MELHGEFDIKSPADKFFKSLANDINSTFDKISKEKIIDSVDWEKRTVTVSLSGCKISDSYKMFKATITVTPKEGVANGSHVAWTAEFEKVRHDIEDPVGIINVLINYLKETDGNLITI